MYLVTFHSNFDANMFKKKMSPFGELKRKPVPRELSSSCGTCFSYEPSIPSPLDEIKKTSFETVYEIVDNKYIKILENE